MTLIYIATLKYMSIFFTHICLVYIWYSYVSHIWVWYAYTYTRICLLHILHSHISQHSNVWVFVVLIYFYYTYDTDTHRIMSITHIIPIHIAYMSMIRVYIYTRIFLLHILHSYIATLSTSISRITYRTGEIHTVSFFGISLVEAPRGGAYAPIPNMKLTKPYSQNFAGRSPGRIHESIMCAVEIHE